MDFVLYDLMGNYDPYRFTEVMRVIARLNEEVVFNGEYDTQFYCDSSYRSVTISFPVRGKLPLEYREAINNNFPVEFSYDSDNDQLRMSGKVNKTYFNTDGIYEIFIQLPPKYIED